MNNHLSQICFLLGEEPSPGALHIVTKSNLAGSRNKYHIQTFLPYTVVKYYVVDVKVCSICLCCRVLLQLCEGGLHLFILRLFNYVKMSGSGGIGGADGHRV